MMQTVATKDQLERVVQIYAMGAICPAELWCIIESAVPAFEVMASLSGINDRGQATLREAYHERPLSRVELSKSRAFARALRKWVALAPV